MREVSYIDKERHPLLHDLARSATWISEDEFPAAFEWADEHEKWLGFIEKKGQLSRFLPRLTSTAYLRDRTFAEVGVAYFLETKCGLPIAEWEPKGAGEKHGDFWVDAATDRIFVEVKTGGWQKDIKDSQGKDSPRLSQPKYIQGEVRSVGNWGVIQNAIFTGYKQLNGSMPSLLIINDDYIIPLERFLGPDLALYRAGDGLFADCRYECLGAAAIFRVELHKTGMRYHFSVYDNPHALASVKLPHAAFGDYPRRCGGQGGVGK